MHVKRLFLLLSLLTSTFAITSFVEADGNHSNHSPDISEAIRNFQENEEPYSHSHYTDGHEDTANAHSDDHSTTIHDKKQDHSDSGHGGGGHEDDDGIEKTPPNYKVLGTFGFINMSFLGIGLVMKFRKRKGSPNEAIK